MGGLRGFLVEDEGGSQVLPKEKDGSFAHEDSFSKAQNLDSLISCHDYLVPKLWGYRRVFIGYSRVLNLTLEPFGIGAK